MYKALYIHMQTLVLLLHAFTSRNYKALEVKK